MIRFILGLALVLTGTPALPQPVERPLVIAHRGASGERPEHTRAAYDLAIDQGADFIEPDLVMSSDGVLIVRHENEIGGTTDVADHPEFAARKTTRTIDGRDDTGWFTEDFTLAELKTLRARERLPAVRPDNTAYDGQDDILTFQEVLDIARAGSARTGRTIGIAPELKHPSYFTALGLPIEDVFVAALHANDLTGADAPILVQCFEVAPLVRLSMAVRTPLLQLIAASGAPADRPDVSYAAIITPEGLAEVATYAAYIGVDTMLVVPRDDAGAALAPTTLIADAHKAGLKVAAWTFRAENVFLPTDFRRGDAKAPDYLARHGDLTGQLRGFYDLDVDAVFSDFPAVAVAARAQD